MVGGSICDNRKEEKAKEKRRYLGMEEKHLIRREFIEEGTNRAIAKIGDLFVEKTSFVEGNIVTKRQESGTNDGGTPFIEVVVGKISSANSIWAIDPALIWRKRLESWY